uniref:Secreted protein n=1 Tax=Trichobilharzia regenti TaxID=157069 RepID=A0AA85JVU4_TRIRE|nr:unnamed protein product [Trichobilharzia regenti]
MLPILILLLVSHNSQVESSNPPLPLFNLTSAFKKGEVDYLHATHVRIVQLSLIRPKKKKVVQLARKPLKPLHQCR